MKQKRPQYVHEIIAQYLREKGCLGLQSTEDETCICELEDLFPCDYDIKYCVPLQEKET